jgi:hypothetical protein
MPQEIFIPSKNKTLTFADDFSEQEIADYIDANFPRTGEDVSHDLKTRLLDPEWNPSYDDFEKLREYNKAKDIDTLEVVSNIFSGVVDMGKNLLAGIPAAAADPASIPGSAVRALKNNIDNYALLAQGGTTPGSKLFELMNSDTPTAYSTWRDAILSARQLAQTSQASILGLPVNPEQVASGEVVFDPINVLPVPGAAAVGKAAGAAGRAIARGAGYAAEQTGRAITSIASIPERMAARAASSLAGVPEDIAKASAADLATKAAVLDVATGAIPGATELAVTKQAGRVTGMAGEAVQAAAAAAEGPAGMLSVTEKALQNPNLSTGARAMLMVTQRIIPRDAALIAGEAAMAGGIGAGLGGGLAALQSTDEEEIGRAIGGGLAAGAMLAGGLKMYDKASGKLAKERTLNDASRMLARLEQSGETPQNIASTAELLSRLGDLDRKGEGLGTFLAMDELISQRGGKVKVVDGDIVKGPNGETGWNAYFDPKDKSIYINSKSADVTTLPHEAVHSFIADRLADDITSRIFTRDSEGRLQQAVPGSEIGKLIDGYLKDADNIKHSDGTTEGQRLRERLNEAFADTTPISEQVSRLRDITHEITARYAEDWVKKKGPKDFLPGAIPTIWDEAISSVRGKLDQSFGRDTGNPILDPVLKRIFDPKETGVPERAAVPLDPRSLAYDWSDKKNMFMTRYDAKSPAQAEKHWREVTKVAEPILKAAGAETPESAYYSKSNISLLNVGEDAINSLTKQNIETDLRSSAPIMGAREAEMTNMLIRAAKTGELIDLRDYMAFLNEGKAESGKAREGNPVDKRVAVVDVFWNRDNGVQALAVDIGSAMSRLAKAVKTKGDASGFTSVAEAQAALSQYLRHVADSETNFDAAKKGWEIEIGGRPMGKVAHKTLHEALGVPDIGKKGLPPFRSDIAIGREGINRVSGVEFVLPRRVTGQAVQTGVITPISNKGVNAVQRRFQPQRTQVEQLPNGMIAKDADGARIVKAGSSGYRLFDPLGERVGVFRTLDDASAAATKQASRDLATVKEVQYAIQEQRAKEISVRQRASYREAVRQGDAQRQEAARAGQEEEGQVRFQPKKRKADRQPPRTPEDLAKMEAGLLASAKRKADIQASEVRGRIERRGAGNLEAERMAAIEAQAREAELLVKPKRAALSNEQFEKIRQAGVLETYVKALVGFEKEYIAITGEAPVGESYRENPLKMWKTHRDAILRLAMSSDLPQAKLAIEAAREGADPGMRAAIERMLGAQERVAALPKAEQTLGVEDVKRSLQTVLPQTFEGRATAALRERRAIADKSAEARAEAASERMRKREAEELFYAAAMDERAATRARAASERMAARESKASFEAAAAARKASTESLKGTLAEIRAKAKAPTPTPAPKPPSIADVLAKRKEVKKASEDAIAELRKRAEDEIAKIKAETEAKLVEAEKGVAETTAKVSAEIADKFESLKKEIAAAEEVISSETDAINPARIILKMKGKYRLYGANAGLIGVFRTKEEAVKKASKK